MTDFPADRPTVPEVLPLVHAIYRDHVAGCCLHVVLDDGNVGDDSVRFCIEWAREHEHPRCLELAELLLRMTKTQRRKLGVRAWVASVVQ